VEVPPGQIPAEQFHAADFDDPVAIAPVQAGGFGVENNLPHMRFLKVS
jgi:hypothetical protein